MGTSFYMLAPVFPKGPIMRFSLFLSAALIATAVYADTAHSVDLSSIDKSVAPGNDFYAYANGAWLKRTAIPPDQAAWGSFNILNQEAQRRTRALIEDAGKTAKPGSEEA
jgi:putative endopeptidase